ncbi:MAG: hypothetical protein UDD43_10040 [Agathobacter sp.]|nr:hypothetical protein [Agathobacter sp.]
MDERKELLQAIRRSRRKLNIAKLIDTCVFCLAYAGVAAIVLEAVSLWIPFYYVHLCVGIVIGIALIVGIIYAVIKRTSMREAAQQIDTFGLKERVQTAYEQMADESPLAGMQRHDAAEQLQKKLDAKQIRIRLLPSRRHLAAAFLSLAVAAALAFVPSQARELANTRHAIHQEAKEKQKELSELADAIEKMDTSELTDEQKARLAKLKEALDRSMQELARADSKEALAAAQSKLGFKYEQTSQSLMELADALSKDGKAALEQIAEMARAAAEANGQSSAQGNSQSGTQSASNGSASGTPGTSNGNTGNTGDGSGENGQNSGNSSNGNSSNGNNSDGNNSGSGDGSGNGSGTGNGSGSGNGNGNGNGSGSGRGTGSGGGRHDYVSVPNATGNDDNLTGNKTGNENGNSYRAQNGMVWEGDHVSLDSVISDYTKDAYEGLSTGKYPSGMEDVIKDYFKNLSE